MTVDVNDFGQWMIDQLVLLKLAGLEQVSWTTVYDGDELATCNVHASAVGLPYVSEYDPRWGKVDMDQVLIMLAKHNEDDNASERGCWILNLETLKLYRTADAWREVKIIEQALPKPEETDLSSLDFRTQAEKDY